MADHGGGEDEGQDRAVLQVISKKIAAGSQKDDTTQEIVRKIPFAGLKMRYTDYDYSAAAKERREDRVREETDERDVPVLSNCHNEGRNRGEGLAPIQNRVSDSPLELSSEEAGSNL